MKPNVQQRTVESNMTGEVIKMGFDADSVDNLANVFVNMYKNPALACLREIATNALDATIEAGGSHPVEVSLPTDLLPTLRIKDYGCGLDGEDIREIYSQFGASTKRGGNDQTGMLGIGCKSPLAYADQFTVESVKDGQRIVVLITRAEAGGGEQQIVSDEPAAESNYTEVQIPCERDNDFEQLAEDLFRFWEPGTIKVNGSEPALIADSAIMELDPGLWVVKSEYRGYRYSYNDDETGDEFDSDYLIMGSVPYPVDLGLIRGDDRKVIARVPIGSIDPTPAREEVMETKRTAAGIEAVKERFKAAVAAKIENEVAGATTKGEALKAAIEARKALKMPSIAAKWKGTDLPTELAYPDGSDAEIFRMSKGGYSLSDRSKVIAVRVDELESAAFITNYTNSKLSADQRRKMDKAIVDAGHGSPSAIFTVSAVDPPQKDWVKDWPALDWEDVKSIRLKPSDNTQATSYSSKVTAGSYTARTWTKDETTMTYKDKLGVDEILADDERTVVYVSSGKYGGFDKEALKLACPEGFIAVLLADTRLAKFKRLVPDARPANEVLTEAVKERVDALTPDENLALRILVKDRYRLSQQWMRARLADYDLSKIDDPLIVQMITVKRLSETPKVTTLSRWPSLPAEAMKAALPDWGAFSKTYPLLHHSGASVQPDQLYLYANAAYAAAQQKGK